MKKNAFYDPYRVLSKIYSEGAHLKIALAQTDLEEINRSRTVKTVYGVLENDGYLSLCIRTFAPRSPKQAVRILLKIALYWILFLKKPRYMVTDTAVDLLKRLGKGGAAGFVNAFLRGFEERNVVLPLGEEGLSIKYNYPLFAVKKICEEYGERAEGIMASRSRGVSVRFVRGEEKYLSRPHENTPFEHLYLFPNFSRDEGFFRGDYTFQSIGSVGICSVIESCTNLFDACAAPGGKSVLLSEKCGRITACDFYEHRIELMKGYLERMHVKNVTLKKSDSSLYQSEWESAFDAVLCDVPCSGLGTIAENPDLPLRKSIEKLAELKKIQLKILKNCAHYVKIDGLLYYATCSILEEENDGVVGDFLLDEGSNFEIVRAASPLPYKLTRFGLQFLPDNAFGAGFYVSKLRRKA